MKNYTYAEYNKYFGDKLLSVLHDKYPYAGKGQKIYCRKDFIKAYTHGAYPELHEEDSDDFKSAKSVIEKRVDSWKRKSVPSLPHLLELCQVLNVDVSYFLSDQEVYDNDVALASNTIGLSYEATNQLKEIKKNYEFNHSINTLLTKHINSFLKILRCICQYAICMNNTKNVTEKYNAKSKIDFDAYMEKRKKIDMEENEANTQLIRIINTISQMEFEKDDYRRIPFD